MGVLVLTVTYNDRFNYLSKSLQELAKQQATGVVIVYNGCPESVIEKTQALESVYGIKIYPVILEKNEGSAGGFYRGLDYIIKNRLIEDKLLMLDDDNLIPDGLLAKLTEKTLSDKEIGLVLREDRKDLFFARETGNPCINISTKNAFLGRDFFKKNYQDFEKTSGDIICAPYSGLVISKNTLNPGWLPDKNYYLYVDDYDFTYRLVMENGCKINFIDGDKIVDLEKSFHLNHKKRILNNRYLNASRIQVYYSVRNQILFAKKRINRKHIFYVNALLTIFYMNVSFLLAAKFNLCAAFNKAVIHGFNNIKGNSFN
ncbi:hypothetical protein [Pantoea sp. FN0307]|uniref:hypothetical protein n=1 Tax=Pantoea sp. FN0307 TaxID=3418560 RepID=UPI003CE9CE6F